MLWNVNSVLEVFTGQSSSGSLSPSLRKAGYRHSCLLGSLGARKSRHMITWSCGLTILRWCVFFFKIVSPFNITAHEQWPQANTSADLSRQENRIWLRFKIKPFKRSQLVLLQNISWPREFENIIINDTIINFFSPSLAECDYLLI